jgi:hypothetical protein
MSVEETPLQGDETPFPCTGPFFQQVAKRKAQGRDAKILVTADHGATGVGKSSLAIYLAKMLDTSADGFNAKEKATLDVPEFLELYDSVEKGSALILDEAEQIDSRRSMSNENVDASFKWQTRRVNEIIGILTLPDPSVIDKRMEKLADYWINVEARGACRIYEKRIHRTKQSVYYKTLQTLKWPNMDKDPDYRAMARMKDTLISGEDEDDYLRRSKVDEMIEKARKEERREARDEWITALAKTPITELSNRNPGLKYGDIGRAFGISGQRVGQIVRED